MTRLVEDGPITRVFLDDLPTLGGSGYNSPHPLYIPHTRYDSRTLSGAPENARWVNVSSSPHAYWGLLSVVWAAGEDFAVIEHDVICRPDVIASFGSCPEPWCVFGYADACHPECMEAWRNELGCVRFRAALVKEVPDAVSSVPPEGRDWHNLCDGIGNNLRAAGFTHHWHFPAVEHHHFR